MRNPPCLSCMPAGQFPWHSFWLYTFGHCKRTLRPMLEKLFGVYAGIFLDFFNQKSIVRHFYAKKKRLGHIKMLVVIYGFFIHKLVQKYFCGISLFMPIMQARPNLVLRDSKGSFYRVPVHVFGFEVHFEWQMEGNRCIIGGPKPEFVAGARDRTHARNWGRRRVLWKPHHRCYGLRSKGSIPEKDWSWSWEWFCVARAAFRMTSGHDSWQVQYFWNMFSICATLCGDGALIGRNAGKVVF